jgi:hypothetical protein
MGEYIYIYIDPIFLHLGISWRLVVSFAPLLIYPREEKPPVLIGYKAG